MKKIILGAVLLGVMVLGWFLWQGDKVDYVAAIDGEVASLEAELASLDTAVVAGTLSSEEAYAAREQILVRLENINNAVAASGELKLSAEQKTTLVAGLDRMKDALQRYRATLASVDVAAEKSEAAKKRLGGARKQLQETVLAMVSDVEDYVEEVVDEYVPEIGVEDLTELFEDAFEVEEEELMDATDPESEVDMADEDGVDSDSASSTEETIDETEEMEANAEHENTTEVRVQ